MSLGFDRTIAAVAGKVASGAVTSERLTEDCLGVIAAENPRLNAFITVLADEALAAAREADREIAGGRYRGALHGIPISLKDLIDQEGVATTAASRGRAGVVATKDAVVTARLREAGAVFVGKTNLHEFAFGTTNEDSGWGPARNPFDDTRSPGGSSGGSAAAVRSGMSLGTVGTDTGGSIRIPSACCGLVGLKPTWGEVSADGVVPLSRQLDHVGPLARSVTDAWLMYEVLRGAGRLPAERLEGLPVKGRTLGILTGYFFDRMDPDVERVVRQGIDALARAGMTVKEVSIPHAASIAPVYLHLVIADGGAYHASALDANPGGYTDNVRLRLQMGRYILAEDYVRAMRGRAVIAGEIQAALEGVDALVLPSLAVPAPPIGAATVEVQGGSEPVRNVMLKLTQPFNLSRHPAISLPCGTTPAGLPVGLQLAGRRGQTLDLLRLARTVEDILGVTG
ncbi:MAG: amidase [Vicinamibacterales bacterium]